MDAERLTAVERDLAVLQSRVDGLDGRYGELSNELRAVAASIHEMWRDLSADRLRILLSALAAATGGVGALVTVIAHHVLQ